MQNTEIGRGLPLLYFCPPKIVDERLQPMNVKWPVRHKLNFEEACLAQPCAGCTMVFNRRALELFLLGNPDKMCLHDSWMYKTVLACGGKIIEDNESHILYRQHGNNVVGTQTFTSRWKRRINNFMSKNRYRSNQVAEILSTYHDYMPSHNIDTAKTLSEYCNLNLVSRIKVALNKKYRTLNRINNFLFITAILFKRY